MSTSENILTTLKQRVEERRQEGKYPAGLEQQLESEFNAIMDVVHRGNDVLSDLRQRLIKSQDEIDVLLAPVSSRSRVPGFGFIHRLIGKLIGRQTSVIATRAYVALQLQQDVLHLLVRQMEIQEGTDVRVLNQLNHAMLDRLMMIDVLAQSVIELERKTAKDS